MLHIFLYVGGVAISVKGIIRAAYTRNALNILLDSIFVIFVIFLT